MTDFTDDSTYLEMLAPLALAELGLKDDGKHQLKIDNSGDLLWINRHGSYTRKCQDEHRHSTAWAVLHYLASLSPDVKDGVLREWNVSDPKDMAIARKAYLQALRDLGILNKSNGPLGA